MKQLLQLALNRSGKIVSVFEVETGLKCNCTCPTCGSALEAKNKDKYSGQELLKGQKVAHFAHHDGSECSSAPETAIHLLAKEVIEKFPKIHLPEITHKGRTLRLAKSIVFDKVEIEKEFSNGNLIIKPDAILTMGKTLLFVEFYKTHAVDEFKKIKIEKTGISTIEIDLNSIDPVVNGLPNVRAIKDLLQKGVNFKKWVYNSRTIPLYAEYCNQMKMIEDNRRKTIEDEENREKERLANINKWKQRLVDKGCILIKAYGEYDKNVYCPELKQRTTQCKISIDTCSSCQFHNGTMYGYLGDPNTFIACGFAKNIKK